MEKTKREFFEGMGRVSVQNGGAALLCTRDLTC